MTAPVRAATAGGASGTAPSSPQPATSVAPARPHRAAAARLRRAPAGRVPARPRSPCSPGPAGAASPPPCGRTRRWPGSAAAPSSGRRSRTRRPACRSGPGPTPSAGAASGIGCTADGPEGPVRLDLAVQAEPELRIVGERLTAGGRDPAGDRRCATRAAAPCRPPGTPAGPRRSPAPRCPDDRLGTALLPLRVAGSTDGQRRCSPPPSRWWSPCAPSSPATPAPTGCARARPGRRRTAAAAAATTSPRCCGAPARSAARRHAQLVAAVRAGLRGSRRTTCRAEPLDDGTVRAVLDRGRRRPHAAGAARRRRTEVSRARAGAAHRARRAGGRRRPARCPPRCQTLTVLADGLDRGLDPRQRARTAAAGGADVRARAHPAASAR